MKIRKFNEEVELPGVVGGNVESWINIKADKDLHLRISRYAVAMDARVDPTNLESKLGILSNYASILRYSTQGQLSIVMILQYLKEIKDNFDPTSSGHLFEDFLAGLIHLQRQGGIGKSDFIDDDDIKYQIKFYKKSDHKIRISPEVHNEVDRYIIGIKDESKVYIWVLDNDGVFRKNDYVVRRMKNENRRMVISHYEIDKKVLINTIRSTGPSPYTLDFSNINRIIDEIGNNLREKITTLYDNISDLNYNIETVLTGVDKNQNPVTNIDQYYNRSERNMEIIKSELSNVKGIMR